MSLTMRNSLLILLAILISLIPLFIHGNIEFGGADDAAGDMIYALSPDYTPWFHSIWEPPTDGAEKLLFHFQTVLGLGFIAYFFRYYAKGRKANH